MSYDGLFLILSVLVLSTFVVIAYFWFQANVSDFTTNQTVRGLYPPAHLNQRCSVAGQTGPAILLPGYFTPQECDYNLTCVLNVPTDAYGICKSKLTGVCNNIFDCAPSENDSAVYCVGGVCTNTLLGGLFSACTTETGFGAIRCDSSMGLSCTNGICLYQDGITCTNNNQCIGGYCLPDSPAGPTGVCISRIPGGNTCSLDFCQTGFFCNGGVCQPNNTTLGSTGAFCSIPYVNNGKPNFTCNTGLVCNFDPDTDSSAAYPSVYGYGICAPPVTVITQPCNSGNPERACIPTSVCRSNICQSPLDDTNTPNVNWCGANSTGLCGSGYICNTSTTYCQATLGNLCNATGGGSCAVGQGTCSRLKLGVYTPIKNATNQNIWNTYDLPGGSVPSSNTSLSVYQVTEIDVNTLPIIKTYVLYYEAGNSKFNLCQITTDSNNNSIISGWQGYNFYGSFPDGQLRNESFIISVKFTKGGNFTFLVRSLFDYGVNRYRFSVYNYSFSNAVSATFDISNATNWYYYLERDYYSIRDWDVDDVYNNNVVCIYSDTRPNFNQVFFLNADLTFPNGIFNKIFTFGNAGINFPTKPTWIRSMTIPGSPSVYNFATNGIKFGDVKQSIYIRAEGTGVIPDVLSLTKLYSLNQNVVNGIASDFNLLNNVYEHQFYYVSNTQFNYLDYTVKNSTPFETPINGYPPNFMTSSPSYALDFGNLDEKLYTIVSICQ